MDWELVKHNFIECSKVYNKYLADGLTGSKILVVKKLMKMGIITGNKKMNGKSLNVYVGMTDSVAEEEE